MALPLSNNAEGGTNGVTVTTGNSGGSSGNAWDVVTIGASGTFVYDNAQIAHGSLSYKIIQAGTPTGIYGAWTTLFGTQTEIWGRFYLYRTGNPVGNHQVIRILTSATINATVRIETTGLVTVRGNGATPTTSTVSAIALNAWNRIEFHAQASSTAGVVDAKLFKTADSTTADETISVSAANTGANWSEIRYGTQNQATGTFWLDDLQVNATGYPGPASSKSFLFQKRFPRYSLIGR